MGRIIEWKKENEQSKKKNKGKWIFKGWIKEFKMIIKVDNKRKKDKNVRRKNEFRKI